MSPGYLERDQSAHTVFCCGFYPSPSITNNSANGVEMETLKQKIMETLSRLASICGK